MNKAGILCILMTIGVLIASPRANAQYSASWTNNGATYAATLDLTGNSLTAKNNSSQDILVTGIFLNGTPTVNTTGWSLTELVNPVTGYTGVGNSVATVQYDWLLTPATGIAQNAVANADYAGTITPTGSYPFAFQFKQGDAEKIVVLDAPPGIPEPALYQIAAFMVLGSMGMVRYKRRK